MTCTIIEIQCTIPKQVQTPPVVCREPLFRGSTNEVTSLTGRPQWDRVEVRLAASRAGKPTARAYNSWRESCEATV